MVFVWDIVCYLHFQLIAMLKFVTLILLGLGHLVFILIASHYFLPHVLLFYWKALLTELSYNQRSNDLGKSSIRRKSPIPHIQYWSWRLIRCLSFWKYKKCLKITINYKRTDKPGYKRLQVTMIDYKWLRARLQMATRDCKSDFDKNTTIMREKNIYVVENNSNY